MTACISDELFHFVGHAHPDDHESNFDTLCRVLDGGTISHPPHDGTWGQTSYTIDVSRMMCTDGLIVPTVTCYCDIPRASLPIHTRKYGEFGLSLSRHHLIQYGARPVTYIPMRDDDWRGGVHNGTNVLSALEATYRGLLSQVLPHIVSQSGGLIPTRVPQSSDAAVRHLQRTLEQAVLAFIKPYNSMLNDDHEDYYYAEREWRKFGNMKFEPADVVGVVVHHEFLERAKEALPAFAGRIWARKS